MKNSILQTYQKNHNLNKIYNLYQIIFKEKEKKKKKLTIRKI